jgi:hypothetical protein
MTSPCAFPNEFWDGQCFMPCPDGYENDGAASDALYCKGICPFPFISTKTACLQPIIPRESRPLINCPENSTRIYNQCLLGCPDGTSEDFETCVPQCPAGFYDSPDKLSCISETVPRSAVIRDACYNEETRSGQYCLGPCPESTVPYGPDPTVCVRVLPASVAPYFISYGATAAKVKFQRTIVSATCDPNFVPENGKCYEVCEPNTRADLDVCVINCPLGFPSLASGGCQRPVVKRLVALSGGQIIEKYVKIFFSVVLGIFVLIFLLNFFRKKT